MKRKKYLKSVLHNICKCGNSEDLSDFLRNLDAVFLALIQMIAILIGIRIREENNGTDCENKSGFPRKSGDCAAYLSYSAFGKTHTFSGFFNPFSEFFSTARCL